MSFPLPAIGGEHQKGGALLVMLVILVIGITTVFVSSLSGTTLQNRRNHSSAESLAKAKEALIGYALTYGDTHTGAHGFLPCPDMDGTAGGSSPYEGTSETCGSAGEHAIGRLPWRTLDLPALYDGAGECLWYAVSGKYKNNPAASGTTMNWDNPGELTIYADNGNIVEAGEVVAAVIAPGAPLSGNSARTASSAAPTCGGNYSAAAYLENDTAHSPVIDNSNIAAGKLILPHEHRDANGNVTSSTNDQILYITRQDIWNGIQKRIARQAKKCLDDYASGTFVTNTNHKYPWAVALSDTTAAPTRTGSPNVRFGRFPDVPNNSISGGSGSCPSSSSPLSHLTAAEISALNDQIQLVQDALNAYTGPGATGVALNDAGNDLKDFAQDSPYDLPWTDPIRSAGKYIDDYCSGNPKTCTNISTMQTKLDAAFAEITDCTGMSGSSDSTMSASWSSIPSCQFISSTSWAAWRDWVFLQIADGYQPGGAGSCTTGTTCLSVTGTGHTNLGSGSYHAAVVVAGKTLSGQNRVTGFGSASNFLEGANATGSTSLETYRLDDSSYTTNNDTVLCIDGKNNCP